MSEEAPGVSVTTAVTLEVCSKELQAKHPQLYHYTSKRGLEGILSTNTVWAINYRDLNDSSEVTHIKEPSSEGDDRYVWVSAF